MPRRHRLDEHKLLTATDHDGSLRWHQIMRYLGGGPEPAVRRGRT